MSVRKNVCILLHHKLPSPQLVGTNDVTATIVGILNYLASRKGVSRGGTSRVGGIHKGASTKSPCASVPRRNIKS